MTTATSTPQLARQALPILAYLVVYLTYLFANPEHELLHWATLVALPAAVIILAGRYRSAREFLPSVGLAPGGGSGWRFAVGLALAFQVVQLLNRNQRAALLAVFAEPTSLLLIPLAFVLLLGTAATTEEFFFRGVLQTRLAALTKSEAAGAALATATFILYHVPYAYLKWPSAGNASAAAQAAVVNGLVGGLPLSVLYWHSRHNLLAAILVHASIDLLPGIRLVASWVEAA